MTQLHDLSALEQAAAIRAGETSSAELTEHYLRRSEQLNDQVGAFVTLTPELALEQAELADDQVRAAGPGDGLPPLLGTVCPVKDLNFVTGVPCRLGSAAFEIIPENDDNVVLKMRAGGLIFTGKTNTPEFGLPCYTEPDVAPPARTAWDLNLSAGGSSGGAAAAVAAGLAPFAHGNDGGGSIRIPASTTGLVGIKPSRGRISMGPLHDVVGDLPVEGPIARTVADAAALLDVMAGAFPGDPYFAPPPRYGTFLDAASREPGPMIIGVTTESILSHVSPAPEVRAAVDDTVTLLRELGHEVVPAPAPFGELVVPYFETLWSALATLYPLTAEQEQRLRPLTRYLRARGFQVSGAHLASTVSFLRIASRAAMAAVDHLDAVLLPTLASLPRPVGSIRNDADPAADFEAQKAFSPYCAPYNVTGQPAISIPLQWTDSGLPVGVQLVGRMYEEEPLISLAASLERARPWRGRRPGIW